MKRHDARDQGHHPPEVPAEHPQPGQVLDLLLGLTAEQRNIQLHVLLCPACRRRFFDLAVEEEIVPLHLHAPASRPTATLRERVAQVQERYSRHLAEDETQAEALYELLVSKPAADRARLVATDPRFASPGVAQRLLKTSAEIALFQPDAAARLALVAFDITEQLDVQRYTQTLRIEIKTMAWCRLADARRRAGNLQAAAAAFEMAACDLDSEDLESPARALFCRLLAALRHDQARIDEALGLLGRAASIYEGLGEFQDLSATLAAAGSVRLADGDPVTALSPLLGAMALDDPGRDAGQAIRTRHALALCYAELGRCTDAYALIATVRPLYDSVSDAVERLRFSWTEARLDQECDRPAAAIEKLYSVVEGLLADAPYDAARALVDLWRALLENGRAAELPTLSETAKALGRRAEIHARARSVLGFVTRTAVSQGAGLSGLLERAAVYLERARNNPELPFEPIFGPPLATLDWSQADPDYRRYLCEIAAVSAARAEQAARTLEPDERDRISWSAQLLIGVKIRFEADPP